MRKISVVLGTNDGKEIFFGHPGDSESFRVYELREDGSYEFVRELENTARDLEERHGGREKMKKVLKLIGDVDVILTRRNSPNLMRIAQETTIQPVMVNVATVEEGMKLLSSHFDEIYDMVMRKKGGERFGIFKLNP